ncbi:MAG: 30S ribosome-binding factor RbfA [Pseudomonadales bacterium]|nr:30S ribosome-binding factor RbfA [Pseudomonadales bacterium]
MKHSPRGFSRTDRIADQIQKDLALLLQRELKDPRVGMTTVSSVKVSKDLSFADVYVSFMGKDTLEEASEGLEVLASAAGFLRSSLAKSIKLRVMPKLRFHYDATMVEAPRISALIDKAVKQDQSRQPSSDDDVDQLDKD